jgi:hypothetical protein
MSVPIDRLGQFIENITKEIDDNALIYQFYPHGSKKLEDIADFSSLTWEQKMSMIPVYCHDQEPLHYKFYQNEIDGNKLNRLLQSVSLHNKWNFVCRGTIYDRVCIIHSEKRSRDLVAYQNLPNRNCIGVYYWSHALIALDWFRYAKYVSQQKQVNQIFLIYNRAWSGTREYRLYFAELLVRQQLGQYCFTAIKPVDSDINLHYSEHVFANPIWKPQIKLENHFIENSALSTYSADFNLQDYEITDIEVVLETLFDDSRLHLTEKTLRPIACGQPFILASTHGSLEYLRSYGFQTFGNVWDESYDLIVNPQQRLHAIVDLMQQIANWPPEIKKQKISQARTIAEYNKKLFFSTDFFDQIVSELKINLRTALDQWHAEVDTSAYLDRWEKILDNDQVREYFKLNSTEPTLDQITAVMAIAKQLQKNNEKSCKTKAVAVHSPMC